jgi:hypothetical protein
MEAAEVAQPQAPDAQSDAGEYPGDLDALHTRQVRWFEESERAAIYGRELQQRDRDYVDGNQFSAKELAILRKRGQPAIYVNYCRRKIDLLRGLERKARTDPKAFPRTPAEDDKADAATQALRYIADDVGLPLIRSAVYDNILVEGVGGADWTLEDDGKGGANILCAHVPWDRLWYDPHSRAPDFSDARYQGIVIWSDRDQMDEMYPDAADVIADTFADVSGLYDDRPTSIVWRDNQRERVRVVQCHWIEKGEWWKDTFSRSGIVSPPQKSPWRDKRGKSACGLVMEAAYCDKENNRYGMVRDLIPL